MEARRKMENGDKGRAEGEGAGGSEREPGERGRKMATVGAFTYKRWTTRWLCVERVGRTYGGKTKMLLEQRWKAGAREEGNKKPGWRKKFTYRFRKGETKEREREREEEESRSKELGVFFWKLSNNIIFKLFLTLFQKWSTLIYQTQFDRFFDRRNLAK